MFGIKINKHTQAGSYEAMAEKRTDLKVMLDRNLCLDSSNYYNQSLWFE